MSYQNNLTNTLTSFVGALIFVGFVIACFFIFSYLLIFGAIIGFILFIVAKLRLKLMKKKSYPSSKNTQEALHKGRTIDQ